MRLLLVSLALLTSPLLADGEEYLDAFSAGLRQQLDVFEPVMLAPGGKPQVFQIKLGDRVATVDGETFDGFRFRCPDEVADKDLVWYFNGPQDWTNWFILPVEAPATPDSKDAAKTSLVTTAGQFEAGAFYRSPLDEPGEKKRQRLLQSMSGRSFVKGQEYILWFRHSPGAAPTGSARIAMGFATPPAKWDAESIGQALHLELASSEAQAEGLDSLGARILADEKFFRPEFARERIAALFTRLRDGKNESLPLVDRGPDLAESPDHPSLDEIEKTYTYKGREIAVGESWDFLLDAGLKSTVGLPEAGRKIYYYDHVGFEVDPADPERRVQRVIVRSENLSLNEEPKANYYTFLQQHKPPMLIFRGQDREVGRARFVAGKNNTPQVIVTPTRSTYFGEDQETLCTVEGDGKWTLEGLREGRRIRLLTEDNYRHSIREEYFPNRKLAKVIHLTGDLPDGETLEYGEDGKEKSRRVFKEGKEEQ